MCEKLSPQLLLFRQNKSWETSADGSQHWVEQINAGQAESPACEHRVLLAQGRAAVTGGEVMTSDRKAVLAADVVCASRLA